MDDQYRDGFERLLSDMDTGPSWRQLSTQHAAPTPAPKRRRGLLVAVAAFVVTIVAIAAVVLPSGGGPSPVAASTVDYVKLAWSQDVEMRCVDMEIVDNGGFDSATIEIWGPNTDGLIRVDVTAPDGTVDRLITEYTPRNMTVQQVWYVFAGPGSQRDIDSAYRAAECVEKPPGTTNSGYLTDPPFSVGWYAFGFFNAIPVTTPDGEPLDFLADLADLRDGVRADQWRGIPVTVFETTDSRLDQELGSIESTSEIWLDAAAGRYERQLGYHDIERLGVVASTIEVVERGAVPTSSISFATDDMALTYPRTELAPAEDSPDIVTTTSLSAEDTRLSNAAVVWVNQTGLIQDDSDVWEARLRLICDLGYDPSPSSTPMLDLASQFIDQDADLSARSDGSLPSPEEAAETLWMIVADPRSCP